MVTLEQLQQLFPSTKAAVLKEYVDPLNKQLPRYHIDQPLRLRAFLAQVGHESGGFVHRLENLNYSADGLRSIFGKYFTPAEAKKFARKPEAIANRVYANRMGNGDEKSGDGWKFRGHGLIQLTGRQNIQDFADFKELSIDEAVAYLETAEGALESACWFWASRNLNSLADIQAMKTITKKINGGFNGLDDRLELFKRSKQIFG